MTSRRHPEGGAWIDRSKPLSLRVDGVAYEGLAGDTYGDAKRFFELSDWQLHDVVCHCHHGSEMTAKIAAQRIRRIVGGGGLPRMLARLWE